MAVLYSEDTECHDYAVPYLVFCYVPKGFGYHRHTVILGGLSARQEVSTAEQKCTGAAA